MNKYILFLLIPIASCFVGCGSDSATGSNVNSGVQNSSTPPSGSSATGVVPTQGTASNPVATPGSTGTRPLITRPALGYGPADGQSGNPQRILVLGLHTDLGIDRRMRVQMQYQSSPGRYDTTSGTFIGGSSNYNTIAATITLVVNGRAIEAYEVSTSQTTQNSQPIDFSSAIYNATNGRAPATIALMISNVKSDYKYLSGFCLTDRNICLGQNFGISYCDSNYLRCMNNNYPYSPVSDTAGWRFNLITETDSTVRIN